MSSITALWRYPLKSARGERLDSVIVAPDGVRSDRSWACIDLQDDTVGSAKHPRRWRRLLDLTAYADGEESGAAVTVVVGARRRRRGAHRPTLW